MRKKHVHNGIEFPSEEEMEFYFWCNEAEKLGIIDWFEHQPHPFTLSDPQKYKVLNTKLKKKVSYVDRELVKGHIYTPDFKLKTRHELPFKKLIQNIGTVYLDTKGKFNPNGGDRNFSINQKWVFKEHGIYIHKVVPEEFFRFTFVPANAKLTKITKKVKKKYLGCRSAKEYLKTLGG